MSAQPTVQRLIAAADGPSALPRKNGELVFESPWESRAFGIALALSEGEVYAWEYFRHKLIDEIGAWEQNHAEDPDVSWRYYERWLASLEHLLVERALVSRDELETRTAAVRNALEHDHDHDHAH